MKDRNETFGEKRLRSQSVVYVDVREDMRSWTARSSSPVRYSEWDCDAFSIPTFSRCTTGHLSRHPSFTRNYGLGFLRRLIMEPCLPCTFYPINFVSMSVRFANWPLYDFGPERWCSFAKILFVSNSARSPLLSRIRRSSIKNRWRLTFSMNCGQHSVQ
ncbi:hypothetical protein Tcan_01107, partial [Toxocara canis]